MELSVCGLTSASPPPFTDDSTNESDFHATLCFLSLSLSLSFYPLYPTTRVPSSSHPRLAGRAIPMDIRSRRYLHDCTPDGLRIANERESIRLTPRRFPRRGVVRKMQFPGRENSSGSRVVATKDLPAFYNRLNYAR